MSLRETEQLQSYSMSDMSNRTGLSVHQVILSCEELERDGYAAIHRTAFGNGQIISEAVKLTELGVNYKAHLRAQRLAYIADKWTDILASAIALCSLIVSITALLLTL